MNDFIAFARGYGLILDYAVRDSRWHRTATEDHPLKKNGAYTFDGDRGIVINFATMQSGAAWRNGVRVGHVDHVAIRAQRAIVNAQEKARQSEARIKAQHVIDHATFGPHPYFQRKGLPKEMMLVYEGHIVVPMRDFTTGNLNSVQFINPDGEKRFLTGGKARGSVYGIGPMLTRERWLVEGFATGLSVYMALEYLYRDARVIVCFSAGNLAFVGKQLGQIYPKPCVFADNDASKAGARAAEETGLPWIMPPEVGKDANDWHLEHGISALAKLIRTVRARAEESA